VCEVDTRNLHESVGGTVIFQSLVSQVQKDHFGKKSPYESPQQSWWKFTGNGGGNLQGARPD
jgi:hypothetical protein